jgi:formate-dependent nitrite reductase cytochrome c552 subunit
LRFKELFFCFIQTQKYIMTQIPKSVAIIALFLLMGLPSLRAENVIQHPHHQTLMVVNPTCLDCHIEPLVTEKSQTLAVPMTFRQDGLAMCESCHEGNAGHMVGVQITFPSPPDLPLDADNRVTCVTCHYTHGDLNSSKPMASFSLLDRLFNPQHLQKSYLLRRANVDGELCLSCHELY